MTDKTDEDEHAFASLALGYVPLSGCIHGGPDAHKWLLSADASARLAAALDVAFFWASALAFVRTHQSGRDRNAPAVREALLLTREITAWYNELEARGTWSNAAAPATVGKTE